MSKRACWPAALDAGGHGSSRWDAGRGVASRYGQCLSRVETQERLETTTDGVRIHHDPSVAVGGNVMCRGRHPGRTRCGRRRIGRSRRWKDPHILEGWYKSSAGDTGNILRPIDQTGRGQDGADQTAGDG